MVWILHADVDSPHSFIFSFFEFFFQFFFEQNQFYALNWTTSGKNVMIECRLLLKIRFYFTSFFWFYKCVCDCLIFIFFSRFRSSFVRLLHVVDIKKRFSALQSKTGRSKLGISEKKTRVDGTTPQCLDEYVNQEQEKRKKEPISNGRKSKSYHVRDFEFEILKSNKKNVRADYICSQKGTTA